MDKSKLRSASTPDEKISINKGAIFDIHADDSSDEEDNVDDKFSEK